MAKIATEAPLSVPDATQEASQLAVREILFPSDLSVPSDRAFDHARLLAEGLGAELIAYHVVDQDRLAGAEAWVLRTEIARRLTGSAREHLECLLEGVTAPWRTVVETAESPSQAILHWVRSHAPDLTVMATHGREGLAHLLLGSVTESVLHQRQCPVLCVREPEHGVALPYRRVLVPTDLSEASRAALPWAALLARSFDCEVLVVHFAHCPMPTSLSGVPDFVQQAFPPESAVRQFVNPELQQARVKIELHGGRPGGRLVDVARSAKADVLVIAPGDEERLGARFFGATLDHLVRHAPCPVLVV